ncbi:hypothetical protein CYMTET_52051 [Cymbomonas tetramitiformis]|uniref:Pentatricopeptide repeat-containing protein n=1 Tax=Cymbomonas tetramitiformis TaxID=36881 RepID=A0AAE0BL35_9CHLO|nr:hypothetical protein CYMTET_52051 [Cymbomonas tetramitiformis]
MPSGSQLSSSRIPLQSWKVVKSHSSNLHVHLSSTVSSVLPNLRDISIFGSTASRNCSPEPRSSLSRARTATTPRFGTHGTALGRAVTLTALKNVASSRERAQRARVNIVIAHAAASDAESGKSSNARDKPPGSSSEQTKKPPRRRKQGRGGQQASRRSQAKHDKQASGENQTDSEKQASRDNQARKGKQASHEKRASKENPGTVRMPRRGKPTNDGAVKRSRRQPVPGQKKKIRRPWKPSHPPLTKDATEMDDMVDRILDASEEDLAAMLDGVAAGGKNFRTLLQALGRRSPTACMQVFRWAVQNKVELSLLHYSTIVNTLRSCEEPELVMQVYRHMQRQGVQADISVFSGVIFACARNADWRQAMQVFSDMRREGVQPNTITYNSLMKSCGRGASWDTMMAVFEDMCQSSVQVKRPPQRPLSRRADAVQLWDAE